MKHRKGRQKQIKGIRRDSRGGKPWGYKHSIKCNGIRSRQNIRYFFAAVLLSYPFILSPIKPYTRILHLYTNSIIPRVPQLHDILVLRCRALQQPITKQLSHEVHTTSTHYFVCLRPIPRGESLKPFARGMPAP